MCFIESAHHARYTQQGKGTHMNMRDRLNELIVSKKVVAVNFAASAGDKLVSASGTFREVGDDYTIMADIYNNTMMIPLTSIAYIEIKK